MNADEPRKTALAMDIDDEGREDTLRGMLSSFYSREMRSIVVVVWVNFLVCTALAVASMALLFRSNDIRYQLLYAGLFICFLQWATLSKIFAWQMIHRAGIKREIRRLELRVAELHETLRARPA